MPLRTGSAGQRVVFATNASPAPAVSGVYGRADATAGYGVAGHNFWSGVGVGAWSYGGDLIQAFAGDYPGGTMQFYVTNAGNVYANGTYNTFKQLGSGTQAVTLAGMTSSEAWSEDFGSGTLRKGRAVVTIAADFAQTVNLSREYHVFLTPLGDCKGLYVTAKTPTSFEVRELGGGMTGISFEYRIVAKPAGTEGQRLEPVQIESRPAPERTK